MSTKHFEEAYRSEPRDQAGNGYRLGSPRRHSVRDALQHVVWFYSATWPAICRCKRCQCGEVEQVRGQNKQARLREHAPKERNAQQLRAGDMLKCSAGQPMHEPLQLEPRIRCVASMVEVTRFVHIRCFYNERHHESFISREPVCQQVTDGVTTVACAHCLAELATQLRVVVHVFQHLTLSFPGCN